MRRSIEGMARGRRRGGDGDAAGEEGGGVGGSMSVHDALGPAGRLTWARLRRDMVGVESTYFNLLRWSREE
jgi:hypothetical protein